MHKPNEKLANIIGAGCGIILVVVLIINIVMSGMGATAGAKDIPDEAATLYGTAAGRNGDIEVEVVATADTIYQIKILKNEETEGIGSLAVRDMPGRIYDRPEPSGQWRFRRHADLRRHQGGGAKCADLRWI